MQYSNGQTMSGFMAWDVVSFGSVNLSGSVQFGCIRSLEPEYIKGVGTAVQLDIGDGVLGLAPSSFASLGLPSVVLNFATASPWLGVDCFDARYSEAVEIQPCDPSKGVCSHVVAGVQLIMHPLTTDGTSLPSVELTPKMGCPAVLDTGSPCLALPSRVYAKWKKMAAISARLYDAGRGNPVIIDVRFGNSSLPLRLPQLVDRSVRLEDGVLAHDAVMLCLLLSSCRFSTDSYGTPET